MNKAKKKVAIFVPAIDKNAKKKNGFLNATEVSLLEKLLKSNPAIDFQGNIDFNKIKIKNNVFLVDKINLASLDLFFWYAPGMKKNLSALLALSNYVKIIKSPLSLFTTADKFLSHSILKSHGLPIAEFSLIPTDDLESMKKIISEWKTIIIKPRLGSFGRGIVRVDKFETFRDIAGLLKAENKQKEIFIERFYENNPTEWMSTTLINGKVIYGYRKKIEKFADWKVYDPKAKGGDAFWINPAPVKDIAEKAATILDKSIVGFDFIKTNEGYKIVDENNFPGFYPECFKKSGTSSSQLIADMISENLY